MAPYLVDDDLVTLEPVAPENIGLGDLVYTRQPGLPPVLHRVIGRARVRNGVSTLLTKGDALMTRDPAMRACFVAGRAVAIRRQTPDGAVREVLLTSLRQRVLQRCLALGSRHAPRSFAAISRRLMPGLHRLAGRARRGG